MTPQSSHRRNVLLAIGAIALAAVAVYHATFWVPLLLDDLITIKANPSIRHLRSLGSVLSPPNDAFSAGRPFLNLTFALNYALGGISVPGYHVLNLLIHILSGIALFGIVRITLSLPKLREKHGSVALLLALAVAILWTLHPIQTESVTYISQRAESLMGLFYFLTLYCFIRSAISPGSGVWPALSVAACALGMMTKEVMVTAPLIVLLYDRTFIAGTFREAWRLRWRIHLSLAATWLVLAGVMVSSSLRSRSVGYDSGFTWWVYALSESKAVVEYLKLALWPYLLVFDYGPEFRINRVSEAAPYLLVIFIVLSLTLLALRRWPRIGFLGAWFFAILAPTSSIVPIAGQPMAENRVYLPLASLVMLAVIGVYAAVGKKGVLIACCTLAIVFGALTVQRNLDYRDDLTIWSDTVSKSPGNFRAHSNLGDALSALPGRLPDAIVHFETALKINPRDAKAHYNLGNALIRVPGRLPDAIAEYESALAINPDDAEVHNNLGNALTHVPGRMSEAIDHLETAVKTNPDDPVAQSNLGNALTQVPGRLPDAIAHLEIALKINPRDAEAQNNLGIALAKTPGDLTDAIAHFETALKINPDYAEAHFNLGSALLGTGDRNQEAWDHLDAALRLRPDFEPLVARLRSAQP